MFSCKFYLKRLLSEAMRFVCNLLSLSRIWLALLFYQGAFCDRLLAVIGAMVSDVLDGYLARRYQATTRFGSILDPFTDKFFVFVCVVVLYLEGALSSSHLCFIFSRDIFLLLFAVYLSLVRGWKGYDYKALSCGKFFTVMQFIILLGVSAGAYIPAYMLSPLVVLGLLYFFERVVDFQYREKKECK